MKSLNFFISVMTLSVIAACSAQDATPVVAKSPDQAPFMATGMKIGEVTTDEAIVWVRLTATEERVDFGGPMPKVTYTDAESGEPYEVRRGRRPSNAVPSVEFPDGSSIDTIEGAVPGAMGIARVYYKPEGAGESKVTAWQKVDPIADFTTQFKLSSLLPDTQYLLKVEYGKVGYGATVYQDLKILKGGFRTAPAADTVKPVTFTVVTGQRYPDRDSEGGFKIYPEMMKLDLDFFVHTGDILYYDQLGKTRELANWHWQRIYSMEHLVDFHNNVPSYFIKDDHDTWMNDAWPPWKRTSWVISPSNRAWKYSLNRSQWERKPIEPSAGARTCRFGWSRAVISAAQTPWKTGPTRPSGGRNRWPGSSAPCRNPTRHSVS